MGRGARLGVAVPVIVFLAVAGALAVRFAVADGLLQDARRQSDGWAGAQSTPSAEARAAVLADLSRAQALAPLHADIREQQGFILLGRSGLAEDLPRAESTYLEAVGLRPASPFGWSGLLRARYELGRTQAPFDRLLVETWKLGSAQAVVQWQVADLGLALWDEIGVPARQAVTAAVAAGMRRKPAEMLEISQRRGRMALACRHVPGDPRLAGSRWLKTCGH